MSDWKKLDVAKYVRWEDSTPRFLFSDGEESYKEAYLRELSGLWERYREELDDGNGYVALNQLQSALQNRKTQMEEQVRRYRAKEEFGLLAITDLEQEARRHAVVQDLEAREWGAAEDEIKWEDALSLRISNYLDENQKDQDTSNSTANFDNRWSFPSVDSALWTCIQLPDREEPDPATSSKSVMPPVAIIYRPPEDYLRSHLDNAGSLPEDERKIQFRASDSWGDAIDKMERMIENWITQKDKRQRTLSLIDFRLSVLDNVLYQYEVFDSVDAMEAEKAGDFFYSSMEPRKYADQVFEGKKRKSKRGAPNVHDDVKEWVAESYEYFHNKEGMGVEATLNEILGIAESHNYEFSRRRMRDWT